MLSRYATFVIKKPNVSTNTTKQKKNQGPKNVLLHLGPKRHGMNAGEDSNAKDGFSSYSNGKQTQIKPESQ